MKSKVGERWCSCTNRCTWQCQPHNARYLDLVGQRQPISLSSDLLCCQEESRVWEMSRGTHPHPEGSYEQAHIQMQPIASASPHHMTEHDPHHILLHDRRKGPDM